jgi:hypothetical protein
VWAILNTFLIAGIASQQLMVFRNTAIVKSINVSAYWDFECTKPVVGIDWGIIEPGENKTVVVYMRNEGNWELTLSIWAANWSSPEAERYMNFTSDYEGQPIGVDEDENTMSVALILFVLPEIRDVTSFSFDVIVEAVG